MSTWLVLLACVFGSNRLAAQCDSLYQLTLLESAFKYFEIVDDSTFGDTLDKSYLVPGHQLTFLNDTTDVRIAYSEYRVNSRWVLLKDWCNGKLWNWDLATNSDTVTHTDSALTLVTRTQTFPLNPGDTVSCFRFFYIKDMIGDSISYDFYDQTVAAWTVLELIDASDSSVIYKMDSLRFSELDQQICINSDRPAMARAVYMYPTTADSAWAFMRVRFGSDSSHWHRVDQITSVYSDLPPQKMSDFNAKYEAANACNPFGNSTNPVSISTLSAPLAIRAATSASGSFQILVYGIDGLLRASFNLDSSTSPVDTELSSGLYYVVCIDAGGNSVGTKNVLLQ